MVYLQSFGNNRDSSNFRIKYENGNVYAHTYEGLVYDEVVRYNNYTGVIPQEQIWFEIESQDGETAAILERMSVGTNSIEANLVVSVLENNVLHVTAKPSGETGFFPFRSPIYWDLSYHEYEPGPMYSGHVVGSGHIVGIHVDPEYSDSLYIDWSNIDYPVSKYETLNNNSYTIKNIQPFNFQGKRLSGLTMVGHSLGNGSIDFSNCSIDNLKILFCRKEPSHDYENLTFNDSGPTSINFDNSIFGSLEISENPKLTGITGDFTIEGNGYMNNFSFSDLNQDSVDHIIDRYHYSVTNNNISNGILHFAYDQLLTPIKATRRLENDDVLSFYRNPRLVFCDPPSSGAVDKLEDMVLNYGWTVSYGFYDHINNPYALPTQPTDSRDPGGIYFGDDTNTSIKYQIFPGYSSNGITTVYHSTGVPLNPYRDGVTFS